MSTWGARTSLATLIAALSFVSGVASAGNPANPDLSLSYTVTSSDLDPDTCAAEQIISVQPGDQVKFCYEVTNTGDVTLNFHDLFDTGPGAGQILSSFPFTLAPKESVFTTRLATIASSQINTATWTARDVEPGYGFLTSNDTGGPVFAFEDISTTGTGLALGDDAEANVTVPFAVSFYGTSGSDVRIGNNGGVILAATGDVAFTNLVLPDATAPTLRMYPFWDDLDSETGNVYYETRGTAPNRRFIVQWHDRSHFPGTVGSTNTVTFQVVLTEGSTDILFQYLDVAFGVVASPELDNGGSATVGLNQSATAANQFSFNTPSLQNNLAIRWSVSAPPLEASDSDIAAVRARAPALVVNPEELAGTVFEGQTAIDTLTIGNAGDDPLTWALDEAPSEGAHIPTRPRVVWPAQDSAGTDSLQADNSAAAHVSVGKVEDRPSAPTQRAGVVDFRLGGGAQAFAAKLFPAPSQLEGFNTSSPGVTSPIGASFTNGFFAGAFAGSDFSRLFAIDASATSPTVNQLFTISTTTGAIAFVASALPQTGDSWTGMSFDPITNTMYASAAGGTPISSRLYTLNTTTGVATVVGQIGAGIIIDIAINAAGQVFGVSISTPDSLVAIDKATGLGTTVGPLGVDGNFAQGLAFDKAADILYWASYRSAPGGELYTVNTATGATTLVGLLGTGGEYDAFDIATSAGPCSSPEDISWLDVSPTSGTIAAGGDDTEVTVTYNAAGLAVGEYSANLCLTSNDPARGLVRIPVELTVETPPDIIFQNGFEGSGAGTPGTYTDRATFLENTQPTFYEEGFASVAGGASPPIDFTSGGYAYTVSASASTLFNDPGIISTNQAVASIVVTFTGDPVTAVGGNFWATDVNVAPTGTTVTITLSNGTVETFTSTGPGDFRGFVTEAPITSIAIDAPDEGGTPLWPTMDNLIVGER